VLLLAGGAIAVTIPLAVVGSRLVRSQLFGASNADPLVYATRVLVVCLVSALAVFLPARRAASVNPGTALRAE
jgi:ABC-type lipoprotein release transport system permease subunit